MILQRSLLLFLQDLQGFYQDLANILGKSQQDLSWIVKILDEGLVELQTEESDFRTSMTLPCSK